MVVSGKFLLGKFNIGETGGACQSEVSYGAPDYLILDYSLKTFKKKPSSLFLFLSGNFFSGLHNTGW